MITYLDASALVKRYIQEPGSEEVVALMDDGAVLLATLSISRAEVSAALFRAVPRKVLAEHDAKAALAVFRGEWEDLARLRVTEAVASRADALAWAHELSYGAAVHLAGALSWRDLLGEEVRVATFDRDLWRASLEAGLRAWPEGLA